MCHRVEKSIPRFQIQNLSFAPISCGDCFCFDRHFKIRRGRFIGRSAKSVNSGEFVSKQRLYRFDRRTVPALAAAVSAFVGRSGFHHEVDDLSISLVFERPALCVEHLDHGLVPIFDLQRETSLRVRRRVDNFIIAFHNAIVCERCIRAFVCHVHVDFFLRRREIFEGRLAQRFVAARRQSAASRNPCS